MAIKNMTYKNFITIMKKIQNKGYNKAEAEKITRNLFAQFNPLGTPIEVMANRVLTKEEYENEYR